MNLVHWLLVGSIIGVISTAWQPVLSYKRLIFSMVIGSIGSISGGVMGYLFYNTTIGDFNTSVFGMAFISLCLITIARRKMARTVVVNKKVTAIQVRDLASQIYDPSITASINQLFERLYKESPQLVNTKLLPR